MLDGGSKIFLMINSLSQLVSFHLTKACLVHRQNSLVLYWVITIRCHYYIVKIIYGVSLHLVLWTDIQSLSIIKCFLERFTLYDEVVLIGTACTDILISKLWLGNKLRLVLRLADRGTCTHLLILFNRGLLQYFRWYLWLQPLHLVGSPLQNKFQILTHWWHLLHSLERDLLQIYVVIKAHIRLHYLWSWSYLNFMRLLITCVL